MATVCLFSLPARSSRRVFEHDAARLEILPNLVGPREIAALGAALRSAMSRSISATGHARYTYASYATDASCLELV
jgi:hypothetical protein